MRSRNCSPPQGAADYLGEPVTVAAHLLQAGARAQAAGAPPALVAAALLHDVGHLRGADALAVDIELSGRELMAGTDNNHGDRGAGGSPSGSPRPSPSRSGCTSRRNGTCARPSRRTSGSCPRRRSTPCRSRAVR